MANTLGQTIIEPNDEILITELEHHSNYVPWHYLRKSKGIKIEFAEINEDSIFYLMSRGLNYQQSKELLINGFLLDVVEKITDSEIKNLIKNIIGLKE